MIEPSTAQIALRAVVFAAAAFTFGTYALAALHRTALMAEILTRLGPMLRAGVWLLTLATLGMLPALAASAGEGWEDARSVQMLTDVATATHTGQVLLFRLAIALLLLGLHGILAARSAPYVPAAALAAAYIASFAFTGHALLREGALGVSHQANHIVHVLAGSFWIGALVVIWRAAQYLSDPRRTEPSWELLTRFSREGTIAVLLIATTGAINTALVLGKLPLDLQSSYQVLLCAKIAVVMVMLVLALANRLWLVPRATAAPRSNRLLMASILSEVIAGMIVVLLVAAFGTMEPV